jgi:hypothetical protein
MLLLKRNISEFVRIVRSPLESYRQIPVYSTTHRYFARNGGSITVDPMVRLCALLLSVVAFQGLVSTPQKGTIDEF